MRKRAEPKASADWLKILFQSLKVTNVIAVADPVIVIKKVVLRAEVPVHQSDGQSANLAHEGIRALIFRHITKQKLIIFSEIEFKRIDVIFAFIA